MAIGISAEHREVADGIGKWSTAQSPRDAIRDAEGKPESLAAWAQRHAEMGLTTIGVAEPAGGGGSLLDHAVALEAAAYELIPGPLLSNSVAALALDQEMAAKIGEGEVSFGIARGRLVLDGPTATHVLRGAEVIGVSELSEGTSPDLSRGMSWLVDAVELPQRTELILVTLAAAEASGIARWCLDTAVDYAKVREQFGKPIGSFQAIKHICADMLEKSEAITAAAWDVASTADTGQWALSCAVARTICLDYAVDVAHACIQVLGGIGFTFEHDAHLYLRRAIAMRNFIGVEPERLARMAADGQRRIVHIEIDGDDVRGDAQARVARVAAAGDLRHALVEEGLLAPHWPAPYGLGAGPVQQLIIDEELEAAGIERPDLRIGAWAAPTILAHGNAEQHERFLRPTLTGEITWCQLFSEPGAGSDLASLRTRAERDEARGGWVLNGQKVWTSLAHESDWGICLARTSTEGKQHAGITYFVLDMTAPGIEIRPLREMTGEALFNEVFLDNVFVPDSDVVGEVNGGWRLAVTTLANERVAMAGARLDESVERAISLFKDTDGAGRVAIGRQVALGTAGKLLGARATLKALAGQQPGAESSVAKLLGVRSRQEASELVVVLLGDRIFDANDDDVARALHQQLLTRCLSIAGGTTQILRNVAGERILGLPR
ncbi:MAG TPA: acyl-CoA dehydrogenase family protein [Marmoricola sp.]|nr:acyl-CoA dehydrogenase family protein [Marmoricola sp.]